MCVCVCVCACICWERIGEYNKTYYRILIWWKLQGVWHSVLQINLPLPQAFMGVYRVFYFASAFISKKGGAGGVFVWLCVCIYVCAFGRWSDAQKHLVILFLILRQLSIGYASPYNLTHRDSFMTVLSLTSSNPDLEPFLPLHFSFHNKSVQYNTH